MTVGHPSVASTTATAMVSRPSPTGRLSWADARSVAETAGRPLERIEVGLARAADLVLAAPLTARVPQPCCDISAMDGYAVAGPEPWRIVGPALFAGNRPWDRPLAAGQAAEIATGAPVPLGAGAVLPVEHAIRDGNLLTGVLGAKPHIRRTGEDFDAGQQLVPAGVTSSPAVLGLAASLGRDTVEVWRRPRVVVALTGDELLRTGLPEPGRVRDAIGPMLPPLIREFGGDLVDLRHLPDKQDALSEVLADDAGDVLVVCGSTSVGTADHLHSRLRSARAALLVDGVACRPGHPQLLAGLPDGRFVVGLPGNPYAALVAALTLVAPLLRALAGRALVPPRTEVLTRAPKAHDRDTLLVAARFAGAVLTPVGGDRPGSLLAPACADVLAVLPPGWTGPAAEVLALKRNR